MTNPATVVLDKEKVEKWIKNGCKTNRHSKSINRKKQNSFNANREVGYERYLRNYCKAFS